MWLIQVAHFINTLTLLGFQSFVPTRDFRPTVVVTTTVILSATAEKSIQEC